MHTWHLENPTLQLERISQRYAGLTGHKGPSRSSLCERFNGKSYSENKKKYAKTPRGILGHKMSDFKSKKTSSHVWKQSKLVNEPRQLIRQKLKEFKRKHNMTIKESYGIDDAILHLTTNHGLNLTARTAISPLTGDIVDLTKEYTLDHWDNAGGNNLENMCILSKDENHMKTYLSLEELVRLSKKIVVLHG